MKWGDHSAPKRIPFILKALLVYSCHNLFYFKNSSWLQSGAWAAYSYQHSLYADNSVSGGEFSLQVRGFPLNNFLPFLALQVFLLFKQNKMIEVGVNEWKLFLSYRWMLLWLFNLIINLGGSILEKCKGAL